MCTRWKWIGVCFGGPQRDCVPDGQRDSQPDRGPDLTGLPTTNPTANPTVGVGGRGAGKCHSKMAIWVGAMANFMLEDGV